jgi:hypothetical protein
MLTIVNVGLLTYKGEQFGVKHSFEEYLSLQYEGSMKAFLADRKRLAAMQKSSVLLAGRVEVPKLFCQREMEVSPGIKIVPLAVKQGV